MQTEGLKKSLHNTVSLKTAQVGFSGPQTTFYMKKFTHQYGHLIVMFEYKFVSNVVHCEWGDWMFTECSVTCGGGTRTKSRIPKVSPEYGGIACDGPDSVEETCNVENCPGIYVSLNPS